MQSPEGKTASLLLPRKKVIQKVSVTGMQVIRAEPASGLAGGTEPEPQPAPVQQRPPGACPTTPAGRTALTHREL